MTRAWIVGNGPSLAATPLHLLQNEVCFGVNRISLIYSSTNWRPTHYVRTENPEGYDPEVVKADIQSAFELGAVTFLPRNWLVFVEGLRKYQEPSTREEYFLHCEHTGLHADNPDVPQVWHDPICTFGSVITTAIQCAIKEGFGPLYLVGCDLGYQDFEANHFAPGYALGVEQPAEQANADAILAHTIARRSSPVAIYNCTIGGDLDVYPRLSIEEVLSSGSGLQPGQREAPQAQVRSNQSRPQAKKRPVQQGKPGVRKG